jgi:predicted metal-dependent peptidase
MTEHEIALERAVLGLFVTPVGVRRPSTFLTSIYCSLKQQWNTHVPMACVNANLDFFINPQWFLSLSEPMRETLIAHEIWHIAFMHCDPARAGDRNHRRWNQACDYAINIMLFDHGFHFDKWPPGHPHEGKYIGCLDERFRGMTAEEIYQILEDEAVPCELPFGEDFDSTEIITPAQQSNIIATITKAVTLSDMTGKEAGLLPNSIKVQIDKLLNPKLPWEKLLRRWFTALSNFGANWSRPSRRFTDVYLPSRGGQDGLAHLRWYLDVSGSVTDKQLRVYNSEIAAAKATHAPKLMTVSTFNTRITKTWEFEEDDKITALEIIGRGGTSLKEVFEDIRKHRPSAAVIISDLYVEIPPDPGIPILWICVDNPGAYVPYGTIIHLDSTI